MNVRSETRAPVGRADRRPPSALWFAVVGIAAVQGNHPDALLIGLTVAAFAATLWLYLDASARDGAPAWDRSDDDPRPAAGRGQPVGVPAPGSSASTSTPARWASNLHRQLEELAEQRLMARHGVSWRVDPERAAPLLGPELVGLAEQRPPYPRLDVRQIDVLLRRIEAL